MIEIEGRAGLVKMVNGMFPGGIGAEIGVAEGYFSDEILSFWDCSQLILVDPWRRKYGYADLPMRTNDVMEQIYQSVASRFVDHPRVKIVRDFSVPASNLFVDESFCFVYLDADHTYESVKEDLEAWYKKVRSGGVFAGHDYEPQWGVVRAVDEFVSEHGLVLNVTKKTKTDTVISWWIIKP